MFRLKNYILSPEGAAGAAGTDKEVKTTPEGEKKTETPPKAEKVKVFYNGKTVELEPAQAHHLLIKGIEAHLKAENGEGQEPDKPNEDLDEKDKVIKDLSDTVKSLKDNYLKDKVAAERREIQRTLTSLASEHDLTKGDREVANMVQALVINDLSANPDSDIETIYKKHVKFLGSKFQAAKKEYVEDKLKDREKTKGPASPGGSPGGKEPEKPKVNDLFRGGTMRKAMDRIKADKAAQSGKFN